MKSRPVFLRALKARQASALIAPRPRYAAQIPVSAFAAVRPISSSSRWLNEQKAEGSQQQQRQQDGKDGKQQEQQQKKKRAPEPGNDGPPQSPFKVFAQVLKEEISKNKAWQENVKQLQGDVDKLADSAAMKRAREVYERARVRSA